MNRERGVEAKSCRARHLAHIPRSHRSQDMARHRILRSFRTMAMAGQAVDHGIERRRMAASRQRVGRNPRNFTGRFRLRRLTLQQRLQHLGRRHGHGISHGAP